MKLVEVKYIYNMAVCRECGKEHNRDSVWCSVCEQKLIDSGYFNGIKKSENKWTKEYMAKYLKKRYNRQKKTGDTYYQRNRERILAEKREACKNRTEEEKQAEREYQRKYRNK